MKTIKLIKQRNTDGSWNGDWICGNCEEVIEFKLVDQGCKYCPWCGYGVKKP